MRVTTRVAMRDIALLRVAMRVATRDRALLHVATCVATRSLIMAVISHRTKGKRRTLLAVSEMEMTAMRICLDTEK